MNIYEKLAEARKIIRNTSTTKAGTNEYSKYDYFTPEQVEQLVFNACKETKTICLTSLKQDQFGYYQELRFVDLESKESVALTNTNERGCLTFELRTEKPEIKATNATQQMGGMDTYSERYIKMKVFQIKDNNLDFDAHDNRQPPSSPRKTPASTPRNSSFEPKHRDVGKDSAEHDMSNWPDILDGK